MKRSNEKDGNARGAYLSGKTKKMPTVDTSGRFKTKNKKHVTKIKNLLDIEDFSMSMLHVTVNVWTKDENSEVALCRPCFEQWLSDTGRLDWCMDGFDVEGGHTQYYGSIAIDDYWENADYDVKVKDLRDYMNSAEAA